jgi:thiol:disulfide interchange protein DsbD
MLRALLLALLLGVLTPDLARAQPAGQLHVQSALVSDAAAIAPGAHFTVALAQSIAPGWHTYWRNPGDSGDATKISWRLPWGVAAGAMQWPAPERMPLSSLMTYGYAGEVVYPIAFTAPANLPVGRSVTLTADVSWLVCSDICIPEQTTLTLTLPVEARLRADAANGARIAQAIAALPQPWTAAAHISAGEPATLSVALHGGAAIRDAYFYPFAQNVIDHAAPQSPRAGAGGLSFTLKAGEAHNLGRAPLQGVLTFELRDAHGAWTKRAFQLTATPGAMIAGAADHPVAGATPAVSAAPVASTPPAKSSDAASILAALVLAFLGGLILNIMPCVLPVLSIKALALASGQVRNARRQGVLYLAGVLVSFLALASLFIALRGMGEAVGWGFQLQSPWVSAGLALLFFVIGLNLAGVFSFGGNLQNTGDALTRTGGDAASFFTGALAAVVATPCMAPIMATAAGAALTAPAPVALSIFAALGLGFALPLAALSFVPAFQHMLPKPGAWMERAKVVLAFPMFATAAWLASVLSAQAGAGGVMALLIVAAALAFVLVVGRWGRKWIVIGALAVAVAAAFAVGPLTAQRASSAAVAQAWSPARVASLRADGKGVFVNFTAAWCVTCQVNEMTTLHSPRVAQAFSRRNIVYLEADWTNPNADVATALAAQGRAGVPLYLYYPAAGGDPVVLPQMLSEGVVLKAIGETSS